jgi:L-asparaginase
MQVMSAKRVKNLVLLGTGGTIAGTAATAGDTVGYSAAQLGVDQLLAGLPLADSVRVTAEQVAQVDSRSMGFAIWQRLAQRVQQLEEQPEVDGIVITHGTDTLEETAYFLQRLLAPKKPVVLACAMRPATALLSDGPQNLLDAITVALHADAAGVMAVCAGQIHDAQNVQKVHPYRLDAFSSGDAGALGYVEDGAVRWVRAPSAVSAAPAWAAAGRAIPAQWPRVEIVMNHVEGSALLVDALLAQLQSAAPGVPPLRGLVAAGTGNGTLHADLEAALRRAQAAGVQVVCASRCAQGRVLATAHDPFPESQGLTAVKARVALMVTLAS